jgi:hypothetical protein
MGEWEPFITNTAFPIGVTVFLLIRLERKLDELNKTILNMMNHLSR